jgi:hypothetical protein
MIYFTQESNIIIQNALLILVIYKCIIYFQKISCVCVFYTITIISLSFFYIFMQYFIIILIENYTYLYIDEKRVKQKYIYFSIFFLIKYKLLLYINKFL